MPPTNPSSKTASTAACLPLEPPPGGLCAIHQPNFFPRLTTLAKLFAADCWIVLDDVQFTRRDYQHRTRLAALDNPADRWWLSIPTHLPLGRRTLIRDAVMAEPAQSQRRTTRVLRQHFGTSPYWHAFEQALAPVLDAFTTSDRTAPVAETSTRALLDLLGWQGRILRSSSLPARPERSQRLADLAAAVGARTYLCGPGGMQYLNATPFTAAGIAVTPFNLSEADAWETARDISSIWTLMRIGPQHLANALQTTSAAEPGPKTMAWLNTRRDVSTGSATALPDQGRCADDCRPAGRDVAPRPL
ncbi:WbqC family protein [Streptomyces olivoreticuli]|uniref:WbqC family protein n=1 Tax=Streptomyces olivoreticuli TaxID=68246 RepID=UPI000E23C9BC